MKKEYTILALIVIFAAFLRLYQLGQNPPSLAWDEVAWGYNAYSLGIDGRDEFGKFLPIQYFESFGDFKPPVYAYLDIVPVRLFGLNEFAVRFPSAFFGTLTILITYFLVIEIFGKRTSRLALLTSLFFALSPWHINLSRAAFEANVATFFLVLGVFLFLKGLSRGVASFPPGRWSAIDTSGFWLSLSAVSFVLSMYTFNTARIVAPLLLLALSIGLRRQFFPMRRQVVLAGLVGLILIAPLAQFLTTPQARLRFDEVNIFSDIGVIDRTNREIANDGGVFWSRMLHNRRFAYAVEYVRHYFDHFNPTFLFIKGDGNPKFSTQDVGQLYLWDLPFLVIGVLLLFKKREGFWWIIPLWMLIGIIPAGTARETPHALRIETTLPTFQILVAYGFYQVVLGIKYYVLSKNKRYFMLTTLCLLLFLNFLYYLHGYHAHYPREYSGEWQYGYKDAILYVNNVESNYDKVVLTEALGRPYIYTLFHSREDSRVFRETAKVFRETYGFVHVEGYGKYTFTKDPASIRSSEKTLYIDVPDKVPSGASILQTFYLLNGKPVLIAYSI